MADKFRVEENKLWVLVVTFGIFMGVGAFLSIVSWFLEGLEGKDTNTKSGPTVAASARGESLSPIDSARVSDLRERALEISRAGRWEVLDVTWIPFPPRSSLYVLLQRVETKTVEDRVIFHLVQQESPRFEGWAKLRGGDEVEFGFRDQPRGSVYLGPFAGPQDYLVPRSAAR